MLTPPYFLAAHGSEVVISGYTKGGLYEVKIYKVKTMVKIQHLVLTVMEL